MGYKGSVSQDGNTFYFMIDSTLKIDKKGGTRYS